MPSKLIGPVPSDIDMAFLDQAAVDLATHGTRMEEPILATRMELSALPEKMAFVLGGNPC